MTGSFPARLGSVVARLSPSIQRHRRYLVTGSIGTLFVVACRLAYPWPLRGVLEEAFNTKKGGVSALVPDSGDPVVWLVGVFLIIVIIQGLAELVQRVSFARFSIGLTRDVRSEILTKLGRGGERPDTGDAIARIIGDSARFKSGLKGVLIRLTQNGTFFVGVCVMLFIIDYRLGVVFLTGGVVLLGVAGWGASRVNKVARRLRRKEGELAGQMHKALSGDIKELAELDDSEKRAAKAEAKTTRMEGLTIWAVHVLLGITVCGVLALGLHDVRTGRIAAADLFTVLFYLLQVHNPTVRLGRQAMRVGRVLASAERLLKLLDREPQREEKLVRVS